MERSSFLNDLVTGCCALEDTKLEHTTCSNVKVYSCFEFSEDTVCSTVVVIVVIVLRQPHLPTNNDAAEREPKTGSFLVSWQMIGSGENRVILK